MAHIEYRMQPGEVYMPSLDRYVGGACVARVPVSAMDIPSLEAFDRINAHQRFAPDGASKLIVG